MEAVLKRVQDLALAGKAGSGHWISIDTSEALGGTNGASRPMELILMGLGACSSMDVLSILIKKRIRLDDYEVRMQADRAEDHPRVFKLITMRFIFYGKDIPDEAVKQAIDLSVTKYCSAYAMLSKTAEIRTEYEIAEKRETE